MYDIMYGQKEDCTFSAIIGLHTTRAVGSESARGAGLRPQYFYSFVLSHATSFFERLKECPPNILDNATALTTPCPASDRAPINLMEFQVSTIILKKIYRPHAMFSLI